MCQCAYSFTLLIYVLSINFFGLLLRFTSYYGYFECYACKEMNAHDKDFDYIVVGSGSAGSIIARRLIEDKNVKVLLIEAGGYGSRLVDIPAAMPMLQKSIYDWQYRTVPQKKACLALEDKVSNWPMGKIVGGTSMLNNMVYVRGHPDDFALWYRNKTGFNYNLDILPYFTKLESVETDDVKSSVIINDVPFVSNLSHSFMQGAKCSNFPINDGVSAEHGASYSKATIHKGHRWTPWHRLASLTNKRNLVIMPNTLVEKILFLDNFEAYGVRYSHLEESYTAKASKGVILAAGVIGSPKLLMLSGIGHRHHLQKMKIPPKIDLPVGDNLQDHVTTGLDLIVVDSPVDMELTHMTSPLSALKYFAMSKGPWTSIGCENVAFFASDRSKAPSLEFMVLPVGVTIDNGTYLKDLVGINSKAWEKYFGKIPKRAFTILPIVLHPRSRGTVRLQDNNPKTPPLIDPQYLSHHYDTEMLIRGIEEIKQILWSGPMQKFGAALYNRTFPGCEKYEFDSKSYWECYVRHLTITSYHPVGTCQLGEVVDYEFQVKGTSKLYVADGSIIPELPSANPSAAIMMMAEKAADVIKCHRWMSEKKSRPTEALTGNLFC